MQRDFQFYDNEIISYSRNDDTLTLYCVYGFSEKWRTCFYHVSSLEGEDKLVGSVISFLGRETPDGDYTIYFRNTTSTAVVGTKEHWRRLSGWE